MVKNMFSAGDGTSTHLDQGLRRDVVGRIGPYVSPSAKTAIRIGLKIGLLMHLRYKRYGFSCG